MSKQKFKVLIIDDSPEDRLSFRYFLQKDDELVFEFFEAELGLEGIEICLKEKPDCVLLDYNLPDTDGLEILQHLNPDPQNPTFPIILLTGSGDESLAVKAMKNGAQDYLVKGEISSEELSFTIRQAVDLVGLLRRQKEVEEKIKQSEDKLRRVLDSIYVFVGVLTPDGVMVECNTAPIKASGQRREDVIGTHFADSFWWNYSPEASARIREDIKRAAAGEPVRYDAPVRVKNEAGETVFIEIDFALTPMLDDQGKVNYLIPIGVDISERKRAEAEILRSKKQTLTILESITDAFVSLDRDWHFTFVNAEAGRLLRQPADALLGKPMMEMFPGVGGTEFEKQFAHAAEHGETVSFEGFFTPLDVWFEVRAYPSEQGLSIYFRDVTERKATEEKLRETEERRRVALEAGKMGTWEWLADSGTLNFDEYTAQIFGIKAGKSVIRDRDLFRIVDESDVPQIKKIFRQQLPSGESASAEFRIRRDGETRWIYSTGRPITDENGKVRRVVGVHFDITTRKRAEEKLLKRNAQLDFLARISQLLILGNNSESELLETVFSDVSKAVGADMFFNYQPRDAFSMELNTWGGLTDDELGRFTTIGYGETLCGRVAARRQPIVLEDIANNPLEGSEALRAAGYGAYAGFPLVAGSRLVGTIAFIKRHKTHFAEGEVQLIQTVCDQLVATLDRRRLTQELSEAEQRQRLALESGGMGAWVWNMPENRGMVDEKTLALFDLREAEWQNDYEILFARILSEDKPQWEKAVNDAIEERKPYQSEFRVELPNGKHRWLAGHGRVEYDNDGNPLRMRGISFDITERKESESEIKALSDYNRGVLESITDPFFTLDRDYRFTYISTQGEKLVFRAPGELLGKVLWDEFPGVFGTPFEKMYRDAMEEKVFSTVTDYYPEHDRWYEVLAYPAPNGVTVYFKNITERKRSELNLAFLSNLQSDLMPLLTGEEIMSAAGKSITEFLNLDHCLFVEIDETAETATVIFDQNSARAHSLLGVYQLKEFHSAAERKTLAAGKTLVINNVSSEACSPSAARGFRALSINALVTAPFISGTGWKFALCAQSAEPRGWRDDEIELLRELTTRIYMRLERARAEENLRQSESFNRTILESSPDCFKILDGEGHLQYMNPNGLCVMEIDDFSTVENKPWWDLWVDEGQDKVRSALLAAQRGEVAHFQEFCPTAKGTPKWWDVVVAPVGSSNGNGNGNGKPSRIVSVSRDITESKRAEIIIRDSEERLRLTMDAANVSTWDWNIETGEVKWSENLERLVGLKKGEFGQTYEDFVALLHPEDVEYVRKNLDEALLSDQDYNIEFRMMSPTGEVRWAATRGRVLRDENGKPFRMLGIDLDITARKQAEKEREILLEREQIARREAENANRAKDEFLAMLSHELRSPLNSMYGWTQMLLGGNVGADKMQHAIEVIARNIRLQNALIEDLLDVSRIISGKMKLEKETVSLVSIVQTTIEAARPAAEKQGVKITSALTLEEDEINGDRHRLSQIVGNILTNAVKFTPAGGEITIDLRREKDRAILSVKDTGIGIEQSVLPHIFDRFKQADASSKRKFGGLGLGLAIVQHLTKLHGGTIEAHSEGEGKGATFVLSLPIISGALNKVDFTAANGDFESNGKTLKSLDGLRILLIDDDSDSLDMMCFVIESNGAHAVCASSAAEALDALKKETFDLMISDIGMADMDGYDLIRHVRENRSKSISKIPAIALTGYVSPEDRERVRAAGFQKHLSKPINTAGLPEIILSVLERVSV